MRRLKPKKLFVFKPDINYLRETMDMPAYAKLKWLQEANDFINNTLSKKTRKIWEKFRKGEI